MARRITSYAEFWPYYLREHADPRTRRVHVLGTVLGVGLFLAGLLLGRWWLVLAGVVSGYLFAWGSHMTIERNRPATFTYPLWSLGSDLRMAWLFLTGRLEAELRRAGVSPAVRAGNGSGSPGVERRAIPTDGGGQPMDTPRMVTVEVDGKRHVGEYRVEGDLVTVRSEDFGGEESGHAGEGDPHGLAQQLLTEIIRRKEDL